MRKIIALIGVSKSGKDYMARNSYPEYANKKFALEVRKATYDLLGVEHPLEDEEFYEFFKKDTYGTTTGRQILINVAESMKKRHGDDYWVNKLFDSIGDDEDIVITDCRYPIELNILRHMGAQFIFCDFRSEDYDDEARIDNIVALTFRELGYKHGDCIFL